MSRPDLHALCAAATPGPWTYLEDGPEASRRRVIWGPPGSGRWAKAPEMPLEIAAARKHDGAEIDANWHLMAACRDALPAALARAVKAEAERDEARAELAAMTANRDAATSALADSCAETAEAREERDEARLDAATLYLSASADDVDDGDAQREGLRDRLEAWAEAVKP